MNITDYIVSEENRNKTIKICVYFPGWGSYHLSAHDILTFGQVYDRISHILEDSYMRKDLDKIWGENYENALANVEVTVQAETEGHRYFCNFRDRIFECMEDYNVLSLAEERIKEENFKKEYAAAKKVFKHKQIIKLVAMLFLAGAWGLVFLVSKELALKTIFMPLMCILLTGIEMVFARMRFEDGIW